MDHLAQIDRWGKATPSHLAHVTGDRVLTYGELCSRSDSLAARLARTLPDDGSPVAVLGHKEPELLIAFLGVAKAGHPYVPLDTALPRQRVDRVVALAGSRLLLTPAEVETMSREPDAPPPRRSRPSDPYYIMFTSGSTGEPKGVVITLGGLTAFLTWMLQEQCFSEQTEVFLNQVPFSFDVSIMDTYLGLTTGGTVFSITADDVANPKRLYQALAASAVTTWVSTPSFARMCLAERSFRREMLPRLRRFLFCGETLSPEVARTLLERFPGASVWNTYGPTEATVATTSIAIDATVLERYSPLPVGYPMPGTRILVVDEDRRPLPAGQRGEIVIAGPNVSPGYIGRPDLTERVFFDVDGARAYATGDLGRWQDGLVFFEGRRDNQVKLHGYRIEVGDVEAHLRGLPGVRDAVVLPVLKGGAVEALAAFVIPTERGTNADFEVGQVLRAGLAERLPAYMIPRTIRLLDAFPVTPNGKADRKQLARLLE